MLSAADRKILRKAGSSLFEFAKLVSPTWATDEHIPFGSPQERACDFIEKPYRRKLVLMPRGFRKSTLAQIYILYRIMKNPNIAILRVSHTKLFAETFVAELEEKIETIPFLAPLKGPKWQADKFVVAGRTVRRKEPTVMCGAPDSSTTGHHPDLVIGDDLIADESARSLTAMEKATNFAKKMVPLVGPKGEIVWLGTRYHRKDPYGWMIDSGLYSVLKIQALDEHDRSTWETGAPTDWLHCERDSMGPLLFSLNYMLEPCPEELRTFRNPIFYDDDGPIHNAPLRVYVDWALGVGQCLLAAVVWGKTRDNRVFIVDGWFSNTTPPRESAANVNVLASKYNIPKSRIYTEQFDLVRAWAPELCAGWNKLHPRGVSKEERIVSAAEAWNRGDVVLNRKQEKALDPIIDNALDYPECEFLDPLDVMAYAVRDVNS